MKAGYVPQEEQPRFECKAQAELRQKAKETGIDNNYPSDFLIN